ASRPLHGSAVLTDLHVNQATKPRLPFERVDGNGSCSGADEDGVGVAGDGEEHQRGRHQVQAVDERKEEHLLDAPLVRLRRWLDAILSTALSNVVHAGPSLLVSG